MNYDKMVLKYYQEKFPHKWKDIVNAKTPKKSFRTNLLKISSKELVKRLEKHGFRLRESPVKDSYIVESEPFSIGGSVEFLLGLFYIQDFTSTIPALELDPKPNELVLDMCSSPGGKTCVLSQLMI